jgi:hypothetical protein
MVEGAHSCEYDEKQKGGGLRKRKAGVQAMAREERGDARAEVHGTPKVDPPWPFKRLYRERASFFPEPITINAIGGRCRPSNTAERDGVRLRLRRREKPLQYRLEHKRYA